MHFKYTAAVTSNWYLTPWHQHHHIPGTVTVPKNPTTWHPYNTRETHNLKISMPISHPNDCYHPKSYVTMQISHPITFHPKSHVLMPISHSEKYHHSDLSTRSPPPKKPHPFHPVKSQDLKLATVLPRVTCARPSIGVPFQPDSCKEQSIFVSLAGRNTVLCIRSSDAVFA